MRFKTIQCRYSCYGNYVKSDGVYRLATGIRRTITIQPLCTAVVVIGCSGSTVGNTGAILLGVTLSLTLAKPFSTTVALSGCIALFNSTGLLGLSKFWLHYLGVNKYRAILMLDNFRIILTYLEQHSLCTIYEFNFIWAWQISFIIIHTSMDMFYSVLISPC